MSAPTHARSAASHVSKPVRRLLVALAATALLTSACTEFESNLEMLGPSPSQDLGSRLLTVEELPSGFTRTEDDDEDPAANSCSELQAVTTRYPPMARARAGFQRLSNSAAVPPVLLVESLSRMTSEAEAAEAFAEARRLVSECTSIKESLPNGGSLEGSLVVVAASPIGDESVRTQLSASAKAPSGVAVPLFGEEISVRKGAVIVDIVLFVAGSPDATDVDESLEAIAQTAVAKI